MRSVHIEIMCKCAPKTHRIRHFLNHGYKSCNYVVDLIFYSVRTRITPCDWAYHCMLIIINNNQFAIERFWYATSYRHIISIYHQERGVCRRSKSVHWPFEGCAQYTCGKFKQMNWRCAVVKLKLFVGNASSKILNMNQLFNICGGLLYVLNSVCNMLKCK